MPTFQFKKLIRDDMIPMYEVVGQKAVYRYLTGQEFTAALIKKVVEEADEIPLDADRETALKEIADVMQALIDLQAQYGISDEEIERVRLSKLAEKGGFARGVFVETLTLRDDDSWVSYYRDEPDKFPELTNKVQDVSSENE